MGVLIGLAEDLLAIKFATNATIDTNVIFIALLVALPFAVFSEIIVDWRHFKIIRNLKKQLENAQRRKIKL